MHDYHLLSTSTLPVITSDPSQVCQDWFYAQLTDEIEVLNEYFNSEQMLI